VKRQLSLALDEAANGPIRLVSMCAGQGRDVIDVLETHPRGPDVNARLVEFDPEIAEGARSRARRAGLSSLEVIVGDAGLADSYQGSVPADVLVVCGVFDNLTLDDITRTIHHDARSRESGRLEPWSNQSGLTSMSTWSSCWASTTTH